MLNFIFGLWTGGTVGFVTAALLTAAKEADRFSQNE